MQVEAGRPFVSIVMPAYNAGRTLAMAVDSVLAQTCPDWELVLVENGSADETARLAAAYAAQDARIRVLYNETNQGVSAARRAAALAAKGDWLAFLDSDDAWAPDKLAKQLAQQAETGARLLYTGSAFMDADGQPKHWVMEVPTQITYRQLLKQNRISNSSVLIEKSLYLAHAVKRDDLHEDFACWLGALRTGEIARGINEPLLIYRLSANSKSGNKLRAARMNWNTYRAVGLPAWQAVYYQTWYLAKGFIKYWNIQNG